jgi:hypothetical protein
VDRTFSRGEIEEEFALDDFAIVMFLRLIGNRCGRTQADRTSRIGPSVSPSRANDK